MNKEKVSHVCDCNAFIKNHKEIDAIIDKYCGKHITQGDWKVIINHFKNTLNPNNRERGHDK